MAVSNEELVAFSNSTGDLMIKGEHSFVTILSFVAKRQANQHFKQVLSKVRDDVAMGIPMSKAMMKHSGVFPNDYVAAVRRAELSGTLETMLQGHGREGLRNNLEA